MILTCPACSTRFLVPDAAFAGRPAADGGKTYRARRVRCGQCRHEWQAEAPAALADADFASMVTQAAPDLTPPEEIAPKPIPEGSNLPVKVKRKWLGKLQPQRGTALVVFATLMLLFGLATIAPAAFAWLGAALHTEAAPRLTIEKVTTRYVALTAAAAETGETTTDALGNTQPTGWSLVVEGSIHNQTDEDVKVPPLSLLTKDAKGALLGTYHPSVQMETLPAHGETGFSIQLGAADPKMAEVTVQFGGELAAE